MTAIAWPTGVPDKLLISGASGTSGDNQVVRSEFDAGDVKQRVIDTKPQIYRQGRLAMTRAQYNTFEAWRVGTLKAVGRFQWYDEFTDVNYEAVFDYSEGAPTIEGYVGDRLVFVRVRLRLIDELT